jgi:putative spermidine/putrescine transport system ATP-binding protein
MTPRLDSPTASRVSDAAFGSRGAARPRGHTLEIDSLTHRYGHVTAVDNVSLTVPAGEIVALLGPSGCGKTTLLRVVAGFVRQSAGSVRIDGGAIDHLPANARNVGIVFQNYALFPHMTAADNVAYGLQARGRPRAEVRRTVERFLEVVRLTGLRDRLPRHLSGGQQQRVAVARAMAVEPTVLLLDEPFSALDKGLRLDMQIELKRLQRQFGLTAILVTHDQDEAMSVADRIAVMNHGRVEQFDTPTEVYDHPATLFVSGFVGTTNLLFGKAVESADHRTVVELTAGGRLGVPTERVFPPGTPVVLSARPEQLRLYGEPAADRWPVHRRLAVPLGPNLMHDLETRDGVTVKLVEPRLGVPASATEEAWCGLRPGARPGLFPSERETT